MSAPVRLKIPAIRKHRKVPHERVDFVCVDIIQLLDCLLDLVLVRLDIHNKHERIVLLNFLHCTLRVQGESHNSKVIKSGFRVNCFSLVFRSSGECEGLGTVEGGGGSDLLGFCGVCALESGLLGRLGLLLVAYSINIVIIRA